GFAVIHEFDDLEICPDTTVIWMMRVEGTPVNDRPLPEDLFAYPIHELKDLIIIRIADHTARSIIPCRHIVRIWERMWIIIVVITATCFIVWWPMNIVSAERVMVFDIDILNALVAIPISITATDGENPFDISRPAG